MSKTKKPRPLADDGTPQRSPYGVAILLGLNRTGKHIYEGTVGPVEKAQRRKRNKHAAAARRIHRQAARR